jgi:hypothetical protein
MAQNHEGSRQNTLFHFTTPAIPPEKHPPMMPPSAKDRDIPAKNVF